MTCLNNPESINQTFIVRDPAPVTLAGMIVTLREAAVRPRNLVAEPPATVRALLIMVGRRLLWDRNGRDLVASSANLQKLGWRPRVATTDGLRAIAKSETSNRRNSCR